MYIAVISYGFVYACKSMDIGPSSYTLHNARCVRKWDPDAGLAALVTGPNKDTVLQATIPVVSVPQTSMIFYFNITGSWSQHL